MIVNMSMHLLVVFYSVYTRTEVKHYLNDLKNKLTNVFFQFSENQIAITLLYM